MEHSANDEQPPFTQEDVEALLAESYIPEVAAIDRAKLTEFANLVADRLMGDLVKIPIVPLDRFE